GGTTLRFGRDNYPAFCPNRFREYSCARDRAEVRLQHMLADNPDKFTSCQVLIRNRTPQRSTRRATSNIVHQKPQQFYRHVAQCRPRAHCGGISAIHMRSIKVNWMWSHLFVSVNIYLSAASQFIASVSGAGVSKAQFKTMKWPSRVVS